MTPFRQFVLKVCSRCDLACDHCYVYEGADQSWRSKPKVISGRAVTTAAVRIAEHARRHALQEVRVILHGGEPLLAGPPLLGWICAELRRVVGQACRLDLRLHTNGVRLSDEFCELFAEYGVKVGISVDGDRTANDRHRRYADGRSSYDQVVGAVTKLRRKRYQALYAGLLCTIDVRNDPVATYDALAALDPPVIDFLFPHATWDTPPPLAAAGSTPYADWLIAVFGRWTANGCRVPVRMFQSVIATANGGRSGTEALGLAPSDLVVIETDGTIEQADSLKVTYEDAPQTGLDIYRNSMDEAAGYPCIVARQQGPAGLCDSCRRCPVVTSCGGGLYAHRYRTRNGFDNPSVYCKDLMKLITHIRELPGNADRRSHTVSDANFGAIASGYGGPGAIGQLVQSQRSVVRALMGAMRERSGSVVPSVVWDVLADLDSDNAPALDEVLAHPYIRAWAVRFLPGRRYSRGHASPTGRGHNPGDDGPDKRHSPQDSDAWHLAAIAAAAAIRAGMLVELPVPVRDGFLHLPTLGRLAVPASAAATVTVSTGANRFAVQEPDNVCVVDIDSPEPDSSWQPVRVLHADEVAVRLEDTDPYRNCHQWTAAGRLSDDEVSKWRFAYRQAWDLITREFEWYAPALTAGLTTITPLANNVPGREISAVARQAFGAVGAALPESSDTLALLLMHEFQHVKLGALLDLFDLHDRGDTRLFYAPWRDDPRPLEALLQGTYAHIAVTEFWGVRWRHLPSAEAEVAAARFALWRAQTATAADALAGSGSLTPLGVRFVAGIQATLGRWLDEPVPAEAARQAKRWADQHRSRWDRA